MELLLLNKELSGVDTLDVFESLIWTDRYYGYGDFEIYIPASEEMIKKLQKGYYLYCKESEHVMVIEDINIETDTESGAHLCVTGRSLESILERRIIWNQTVLNGSLQDGIEKLLNENAISPSDPNRKISNISFKKSEDPAITELTLSAQFWGEYLYDAVQAICEAFNLGFKILLEGTNFVFSLYAGVDRSYNQTKNPYVVFSPNFDNLLNSNYLESDKTLKTIVLVAGEGQGSNRKTVTAEVSSGAGTGLDRREIFLSASDVSKTVNGSTVSDSEYLKQLKQRGDEELSKNKETVSFEGQVDSTATYFYGSDYYLGDIVQVANEFGNQATSRVVEYVRCQDENGIDTYPTFDPI